jgi:hypothetical protein
MHIKLTNGQPENYSIGQLRRDNPQVSFPKTIPDATLAEYDVYPLKPTDRPQVDHTKNVTEGTPAQQDGEWVQVWDVTDAAEEEIAQRTDEKATSVRSQRDDRLTRSDWTQVADAPVDQQAWADYRQALRDVPSQAGFPYSVIWPEQPTA